MLICPRPVSGSRWMLRFAACGASDAVASDTPVSASPGLSNAGPYHAIATSLASFESCDPVSA